MAEETPIEAVRPPSHEPSDDLGDQARAWLLQQSIPDPVAGRVAPQAFTDTPATSLKAHPSPSDEALQPVLPGLLSAGDGVAFALHDASNDITVEASITVYIDRPMLCATWQVRAGSATTTGTLTRHTTPQADWDVMTVGPVTMRINELGHQWLLQLNQGGIKLHLVATASGPPSSFPGTDMPGDQASVNSRRYTHVVHAHGDVMTDAQRVTFTGIGSRERSWLHHEPSRAQAFALRRIAQLALDHGEKRWGNWAATLAASALDNPTSVATTALGAFGGMGSVNDVVICPENGHRIAPADIDHVDHHLSIARALLFTAATAIVAAST
jgi:hypothetical protein